MEKISKQASQIRLDPALFEKIRIIADAELRTMNAQMEYFLLRGVRDYESINGPVIDPRDLPEW